MESDDQVANLLLAAEIRRQIQAIRRDFFAIIDGLRTDDKDNYDQLASILNDNELARKFQLFLPNRDQAIRKNILDATNNAERMLSKMMEGLEVYLKDGTELQTFIKSPYEKS